MEPSTPQAEHRRRRRFRISRDGALFLTGLAGIVYETVIHTGPARGELILAFLAMTGVPAFLRLDEARRTPPPTEDA
jgi:hypothetical protein